MSKHISVNTYGKRIKLKIDNKLTIIYSKVVNTIKCKYISINI